MINLDMFYVIMFGLMGALIAVIIAEVKQLRRTVSLHHDILVRTQNFLIDNEKKK